MSGIAGITAVCSGAILNGGELRARHRCPGDDDAQLVARLYEQHPDAFAGLLRGPFAVAIWDEGARRRVLARDRFGLEPLFYRPDDLELASDLRGEIDPDGLDAFLALGWIPAPLTIVRGVRKLPPGHLLVREDGGEARLARFARPAFEPADDLRTDDVAELAEELRSRLRDSVRAHLRGAERVGVLSDDVYSAIVAALAAQERTDPIRTLSPVREPVPVLRSLDEPVGDPRAVAAPAADDVDVVLSGEGGAALFEPPKRSELFTPEERAQLTGRRSHVEPATDFVPLQPRGLRKPFLDTIVTNLALALPSPKTLLRRAAEPLLPRAVLRSREPALPIPAGLRSLARETLAEQELFDPAAVRRLLEEYDAGRKERARQLWALLAFTVWHERRDVPTGDLVADASPKR